MAKPGMGRQAAEVSAKSAHSNGDASTVFQPEQGHTARRILIVDDNRDSVDSLAKLLRLTGHEVETALDGPTGINTARRYQPEIIFLDIGLPEMDGYEIAKRLREDASLTKVTLIAMTGWGQEEDKRRAMEAGFDQHLTKPVEISAIEDVLSGMQTPS